MRSTARVYWIRSLVPTLRKSASPRQLIDGQRGRRHFDHGADRHGGRAAQLPRGGLDDLPRRAELVDRRHERQQDAQLACRSRAQQCPHLRSKPIVVQQRRADAAQAEAIPCRWPCRPHVPRPHQRSESSRAADASRRAGRDTFLYCASSPAPSGPNASSRNSDR